MTRRLFLLAAAASLIAAGPTQTLAQTAVQTLAQTGNKPAVTVVAFTGGRGAKLSADQGAAIADELARQLVEGGHYRVLQREWLPTPQGKGQPSVTALRASAASADVDYLVMGTVDEFRRPVSQPYGPFVLEQSRFGAHAPSPAFRSMPRLPVASSRRRAERQMVALNIQVIAVASGKVVTRATVEHPAGNPGLSATAAIGPMVGGPAGAVIGAASHLQAARDSGKLDKLDKGIQTSIDDIALRLSFSSAQLAHD